ncbi:MAG: glycosyltransferase [Dysgonamonadaceae bacterium]|jgi:hypothetical protein|nr:glycosyltransferase [Dysgonamonadaceae bacterium]
MKTKIVYTVVSSNKDYYFEQAFISVTSLRMRNPDAWVTLVMDDLSGKVLKGRKFGFDSIADEQIVITIDNPRLTNYQRSRWLKTNVREYVEGDFLFVDSDTVINGNLEEIDSFDGDLGAVRDIHTSLQMNPFREMAVNHAGLLGYDCFAEMNYFNSGVIYAKDNRRTRDFYRSWHEEWKRGTVRRVYMDQPSFNKANHVYGGLVKVLADEWNCLLKYGLPFFDKAKIIHCLATKREIDRIHYLMEDDGYENLKKTGQIDDTTGAILREPLKHFNIPLEIIGKKEIDLKMTDTLLMLKTIYFNYPALFRIINKAVSLFLKLRKRS